ncbi:hypothetical protein [Halobacillus sp. Marseille-Q1614]|uniref:hypothetical protein n=1 Tax=Halobacillus sp. Marseille-Q1614 TaxID=2709134 RepID=UPI0015715E0E|nr:hypothetical protein [Halobacillus sp. Marseille-Q1614]
MRKVIDGKLYDSEKADLVYEFQKYANVNSTYGQTKAWGKTQLFKRNWSYFAEDKTSANELNKLDENALKEILAHDPEKYQEFFD